MTLDKLTELLSEHGLTVPMEWNTDKPIRDEANSQWFIGTYDAEHGEYSAKFGDWKRGLYLKWSSVDQGEMTDEERRRSQERMAKLEEAARAEREQGWLVAREQVQSEWATFGETGHAPYFLRKGIRDLYGCRIKPNEHGDPILIVPMHDAQGVLWNFQRIYAQKLSKGDKFFYDGARIQGCFHYLPNRGEPISDGDPIFISEGIATAASIAMSCYAVDRGNPALDKARVVASFNAGNLLSVAMALRGSYPNSRITLCGDNDAFTEFPVKGGAPRPYNVGIEKAKAAAQAVGGELRWPTFKFPDKKLTDFNDLATVGGIDEVYRQITAPNDTERASQEKLLKEKPRKSKAPPEKLIADLLVKEFDGKLVRTDEEVFGYTGTHWVEFRAGALAKLKQKINEMCLNSLSSNEMSSYLRTLIVYLPQVPEQVDMFSPNPFIANFLNGSLHFLKSEHNKFRLEFHPHSKLDYLTSVLPFEFPGFARLDSPPTTPLFDEWCKRVFGEDGLEDLVKCYTELGGVGILQAFPIISFFQGATRSGKSTAIKLIVKMLSEANTSSVQPGDWYGFKLEPMLGKLVNFDLDLNTTKPIQDTIAKKVFDRAKFMVERKGKRNIFAPLPSAHLFACNDLPPTNALTKDVYQHRFVVLKFGHFQAPKDSGLDFDEFLWQSEGPGIVCHFLNGLMRLAKNGGNFTKPSSSISSITEMEIKADPVRQFLWDLREGFVSDKNTTVFLDENARMPRPLLWEIFAAWQDGHTKNKIALIGRTTFFERMAAEGFKVNVSTGVRFVQGIGSRASEGSVV